LSLIFRLLLFLFAEGFGGGGWILHSLNLTSKIASDSEGLFHQCSLDVISWSRLRKFPGNVVTYHDFAEGFLGLLIRKLVRVGKTS
jgi:hypothetical protein